MLDANSGEIETTDNRMQRILFMIREFSTIKLALKTACPSHLNELYDDLNIIYHSVAEKLTN